jgi:hypothetical protein
MIPGHQADVVRRFTVPQAGSARITGNVHAAGGDCGGGVSALIKRGGTVLFQREIASGDVVGFNFDLDETVSAGDTLDFVVNQGADGNNYCDETAFDPTIVLTPRAEPASTPTFALEPTPAPERAPASASSIAVGFFKLSGPEIYYSNGSQYCHITSWEKFLSVGGQADLSNVLIVSSIPSSMSGGGPCN